MMSVEFDKEVKALNQAVQGKFVKTVLHRCVDLGWRDSRLAEEAGISRGHWSEIRAGKKSPSFATILKIAEAVELRVSLDFVPPAKSEEPGKE